MTMENVHHISHTPVHAKVGGQHLGTAQCSCPLAGCFSHIS